ncbi:hypothetical protein CCS77_1521 [Campylobacter concisus]|uniref:Uncharacterized protein n=1 Tax=Campylobacter concisus TaxID=199 RepID=A0A2R4P1K4_9BACT|nr:hypothetical protein CCS77_1521 [Campylobacter concisus]
MSALPNFTFLKQNIQNLLVIFSTQQIQIYIFIAIKSHLF